MFSEIESSSVDPIDPDQIRRLGLRGDGHMVSSRQAPVFQIPCIHVYIGQGQGRSAGQGVEG